MSKLIGWMGWSMCALSGGRGGKAQFVAESSWWNLRDCEFGKVHGECQSRMARAPVRKSRREEVQWAHLGAAKGIRKGPDRTVEKGGEEWRSRSEGL